MYKRPWTKLQTPTSLTFELKEKELQNPSPLTIYELTVNALVSWQAHSLSNEGTNGSNKVMPRSQMPADGSIVDAGRRQYSQASPCCITG